MQRKTLSDYINRRKTGISTKAYGGKTIFNEVQEHALAQRVLQLSDRGFPLSLSRCKMYYDFSKVLKVTVPRDWVLNKIAGRIGIFLC